MTEKGSTCAEELFIDVPTEQECFKALTFANETQKNATYQGLVSKDSLPGGCLIFDDGRMFFNSITTNGRMFSNSSGKVMRNVNDERRSSEPCSPDCLPICPGPCWNLPETIRSICKQGTK